MTTTFFGSLRNKAPFFVAAAPCFVESASLESVSTALWAASGPQSFFASKSHQSARRVGARLGRSRGRHCFELLERGGQFAAARPVDAFRERLGLGGVVADLGVGHGRRAQRFYLFIF